MNPSKFLCPYRYFGNLTQRLVALGVILSIASASAATIPEIQAELRSLQFDKAIVSAKKVIDAKGENADHALYLKATAEFQGKKFSEAVSSSERLIVEFPNSGWKEKAIFLKAQAFIEQKKFAEAAAIYETESARLLSPERKQALVGEILRFAEKLEAKQDPNVPDSPPPNFAKAYSLYTKALEIELPRDFRDSILFSKARAIQQTRNPTGAIQDYQKYLAEYDPTWVGPAGSGADRQARLNPPPGGKNIAKARFRLAESFYQVGNPDAARMELEDLLKMINKPNQEIANLISELATEEGKKLPEEIRWLALQTFYAPGPSIRPADAPLASPSNGGLDQAIKAGRDYIAAHSVGTRAIRAAWMLAESFQSYRRSEDAISAYRDIIASKGFRLPDGEVANTIEEEIGTTPATHLANLQMRALFRIGQLLASQKKYEEAITTWQTYVKDYPNGPEWPDSQNAIINAEFEMGIDALIAKEDELAMKRFDAFLRSHPLDSRAPRILYLYGAIHEAKALDLEDKKADKDEISNNYRKAIDEWAKLISKYPSSSEARSAILKSGSILEQKLGEFTKALKLYQKLASERGDSDANQSIERLTKKSLDLSSERVFRTNEKPVVNLQLRNIEKCEVRIYKIDLQAYFRKMHAITDVKSLDVSLIQPNKTWTFKPENYEKYKPLKQDVEIPFEGEEAGAYVVTVGDEDWESTVLVLRSDLEVIVKSSRREVFAFVQDMRTGKPASGVELLVSNGSAVATTGKTGSDGVFKTALDELKDLNDIRVFALRANHSAAYNLSLSGLGLSSGLKAKGYLYTDRPAYLRGETVSMRGILRDVKNDVYVVPESADFKLTITDPKGRVFSEQAVTLSKFGSFDATIPLPAQAAIGTYTMTASQIANPDAVVAGKLQSLNFQGTFEVHEFKLEKIKLTMDFPRRVWFRGEKIEATIQASYYWGEPLAKRMVHCRLPDRRIERITTDAEGKAKLSFDTTGLTPGSILPFVVSLDGENVVATDSLTLASLGFSIDAEASQSVVIAGEPFNINLTTADADGKPGGQALKVAVMRMETQKKSRILSLLPWSELNDQDTAEVKHSDLEATTDATTGKTSIPLNLEKGGRYTIRISGTDRFSQTISTEVQVEVSDDEDSKKLRFFAENATLKVGEESKVRLHSRLEKGLALLTYEGESILRYQILELTKNHNEIGIRVDHELFPNFRLAAAVMDGRCLYHTSKEFKVERELKVVLKPINEQFLPGEEGKVEITVTDQSGKPVEAELSLALVNEALYAVANDTVRPILDFFQNDAHRNAFFKIGATNNFSYPGITVAVNKAIAQEENRLARDEIQFQARRTRNGHSLQSLNDADTDAFSNRAEFAKEELFQASKALAFSRPNSSEDNYYKSAEASRRTRREIQGEGRWFPSIITGADGKAVATIKMPETTTAWRLTARGCSVETLVGQAMATTVTRKDFFVDLKTPSFLREGDDVRFVARIHNQTDYAGSVPLNLKIMDPADPTKVLATRETSVEVKAKQGGEVTFDSFTIPNSLKLTLEVSATAGQQNDRLAIDIPVQPWGIPYVAHSGGSSKQDTAATLTLPEGREYTSQWMTIAIGPEVRDAVLDMALQRYHSLHDFARIAPPEWGGHDAHDLLATASALAYANQSKANEAYTRQLAARARALVASLVSSQSSNGSWNSSLTNEFTTARAYWALVEARKAGIAVNQGTLDLTADFLNKQLQQFDANSNNNKAVVLHALSVDKRADFATCNRLYRERNTLGSASLAYLARAFYNLDRKEIALELAGILEEKAKEEANKPILWEPGYKYAWLNDTTETAALVLLALSESKPDSPRAAAAAEALLHSHGCFGYHTGRARGTAVAALSAWFGRGKEQSTDLEIAVYVNGKEVNKIKAVGSQGTTLFEVPKDALKAGNNLVEFKARGNGLYTYAVSLFGFSKDTSPTDNQYRPRIEAWKNMHAPLEYRGKSIEVSSSSPIKNLESGQRMHVYLDSHYPVDQNRWFVLDIPLPAGTRIVTDSLHIPNNWKYEILGDSIRVFFSGSVGRVSYDLTGYIPGKYRVLPTTIRELGNPAFLSVGPTQELNVLPLGEKSTDPYVMNISERYALGRLQFNDGDYAKAFESISAVYKENPTWSENEVARMLLWIHTLPEFYDARKAVEMFEILRERYPSLEIPFERLLVVGKAYRDINENERAWLVYRAIISASFTNDASISAVLEDEGRFLASIDFQERLWREYPDTAETTSAYFVFSQLLYQKAPKAHELPKEDEVQPDKIAMLQRTSDLLGSFLSLYPTDPLADDAGFSLCNAMLDLKNYPVVVKLSNEFSKMHATSELAPSFQYMAALGLFWQNQYGEALSAAQIVADGNSKDRDFARYILGQIYHAQSKPKEAIGWYEKVKTLYPDAQEAIQYFEKKSIRMEEVTVVKPGEKVSLPLKYRNIKEAFVQVYRVDLMKLYLQEKNLSAITSVQLAGIKPESEETIALGDGKDYVEKEKAIPLNLKDEAAYLIICRGDDLFTSAMVLITPLKIEVQEDAASGRIRANVLDTSKGGYRPEVHVKAIGSADTEFRSGETDLRGLYIADNLRGKATVIAREGASRYAFFRGSDWLGAPENAPAVQQLQENVIKEGKVDFKGNLKGDNDEIQDYNNGNWNLQRRAAPKKGLEIEKAY